MFSGFGPRSHRDTSKGEQRGQVGQVQLGRETDEKRTRNRRETGTNENGNTIALGSYLLLVDYTSRLFRNGKARVNAGVKEIFERLGTSQEFWFEHMKKMLSSKELYGRYFASNRDSHRKLAADRGQRHLDNLSPQASG